MTDLKTDVTNVIAAKTAIMLHLLVAGQLRGLIGSCSLQRQQLGKKPPRDLLLLATST
jgi:hypothetical protein